MRHAILLALILLSSAPVYAQAPAPAPLPASAADRIAIGASVQRQLTECWNLPPGFDGFRVTVSLVFFGDGRIYGEPEVRVDGGKSSAKLQPLVESAVASIRRCAPFEGLTGLGAKPTERFAIDATFQG